MKMSMDFHWIGTYVIEGLLYLEDKEDVIEGIFVESQGSFIDDEELDKDPEEKQDQEEDI